MENENLSDVEKLFALSMIFELYKKGRISYEEFQKICELHKELLVKNNTSFSHIFD